jgi:hypothetical protein
LLFQLYFSPVVTKDNVEPPEVAFSLDGIVGTVACVKYPESLFNSDTFVGIYATISANTSDETPPEPPVP